jgi:hypothetical protein
MKTLFLAHVVAVSVSAAAGQLLELSTARGGPTQLEVPTNRLVRVVSVSWNYEPVSYSGPRAEVWWSDRVSADEWEVVPGSAFLGPGVLRVVKRDPPREHVLVLVELVPVQAQEVTNQVRVAVEASPDLASWQAVGQVAVPAPAPGQAVYVRVRPEQEGR